MNYVSQLNAAWEKISDEAGIKPTSIVVYFALLQINNLAHWKPVFNATFGQVLNITGIGNTKTYYSALDELVARDFIIWNRSKNQYQAATFTIIPLYQKTEEHNTAVPKNGRAIEERADEQGMSERMSKGNILKQENNKHINNAFEEFWNLYDKKTGKEKTEKKWSALNDKDREAILKVLPAYVKSTPEKTFRKDPLTYLNGRNWEDEITQSTNPANAPVTDLFVFGAKPTGYTNH